MLIPGGLFKYDGNRIVIKLINNTLLDKYI